MRTALIPSVVLAAVFGADGAAAQRPVMISPRQCPVHAGGATQDPFYDVTAIQGRKMDRGRAHALVVSGRYRANENSGTWALHTVRYRSVSRMLDLELRRASGPRLRNPPCVNFSGSFTNGNPADVRIRDPKGRSITVHVHEAAGPQPRR